MQTPGHHLAEAGIAGYVQRHHRPARQSFTHRGVAVVDGTLHGLGIHMAQGNRNQRFVALLLQQNHAALSADDLQCQVQNAVQQSLGLIQVLDEPPHLIKMAQ